MTAPDEHTRGRVDALVTDAQARAAVAGVRALGHAGLRCLIVGSGRGAAGLWSRHATVRALCPPAGSPGFVERIGELAERHGPLVVHPAQEATLDPLIEAGAALPPQAILPYGDAQALRRLRDKSALAALAERAGLATPRTLAQGPAGALLAAPPGVPCAVKAVGLSDALPSTRLVDDDDALRILLESVPPEEQLVVQERAAGPLIGLALVLDRDGRVAARFQQVALRLWPSPAGASSVAVSTKPDPELVERTARMLRLAGHWGLAHLQFLSTPRGPALIDVNVRYYGSMPLATTAGVNLPATLQAVALGETVRGPCAYAEGVTYRWLEGDLKGAVHGHSRARLRPPPGHPRAGAMWASDDPVPGALLAMQSFVRVGTRARKRRAGMGRARRPSHG